MKKYSLHISILLFFFCIWGIVMVTMFNKLTAIQSLEELQTGQAKSAASHATVIKNKLKLLSRGIYVDSFFSNRADERKNRIQLEKKEVQLLKEAGFTACRLPISPIHFINEGNPEILNKDVKYLDHVINMFLQEGMAVILDGIYTNKHDLIDMIKDEKIYTRMEEYWKVLASRYAGKQEVFFEVLDQPYVSETDKNVTPIDWLRTQEKLAKAIRQVAPENTIIICGEPWLNVNSLKESLNPLKDNNIVYSFHFVKYNEEVQWEQEALTNTIRKALDWSTKHKVPVICTEFGAYKSFSSQDSKLRYLEDCRKAFEEYHIGWVYREYGDDFVLTDKEMQDGKRITSYNEDVLKVLGLKIPIGVEK